MSRRLIGSLLIAGFIIAPNCTLAQTHRPISKEGSDFFDACDPSCGQPATIRSVNQGRAGGALLSYSKSWPGLDSESGYTENFQSFHWLSPETFTQRLFITNNGVNNNGSNRVRFEPLVVADGERAAAFSAMMNIGGSQNMFNGGDGVGDGNGSIQQAYLSLMNRIGPGNIQWSFFPLSVRKSGDNYFVGNQNSAKSTIAISSDGHSIVFDSLVTDMAITNAASGGQIGPGLYLAQVPNANGAITDRSAVELKKIVIPSNLIGCTDTPTTSNILYGAATLLNTYNSTENDPTRRDLAIVAFTAACKSGDQTRHVLMYNEASGVVSRITPAEDCSGTVQDCDSDTPRFSRDGAKLFYSTKYLDSSLDDMGLGKFPARGKWRIVMALRSGDQFIPSKVASNLASNVVGDGPAPEATCPVELRGTLSMVVLSQLDIIENSVAISDRPLTANDYQNADIVAVDTSWTSALRQAPLVVSSVVNNGSRTVGDEGSGLRRETASPIDRRCQVSIGDGITVTYSTAARNLVSTGAQSARFAWGQVVQTMLPCMGPIVRGKRLCTAQAETY